MNHTKYLALLAGCSFVAACENPVDGDLNVDNPDAYTLVYTVNAVENDSKSTLTFPLERDTVFSVYANLSCIRDPGSDITVEFRTAAELVDAYNEKHGTSYEPIAPARVSLGTLGVAAGAFLSDEVSVTVSSAGIEKGYYLIPIVVELPAEDIYTSKEPLVRYLLLTVSAMEIDVDATALTGVKIEPASGWTIVCYQGTASSGANGVWNLDSDAQKACLFDGKLDSNCWYAANASYSWGNGGNFIITLDKAYDINGFRWHIYYEDSNPECTDFQYSEDYL